MDESERHFEETVARHRDLMGAPATPDAIVGARIRERREELKLTQDQLGGRLGRFLGRPWPKQMISSVETGRRDLNVTELLAFAAVLGRPVPELLDPRHLERVVQLPSGPIEGLQMRALVLGALEPGTAPIVSEITRLIRGRIALLESTAEHLKEHTAALDSLRERKE